MNFVLSFFISFLFLGGKLKRLSPALFTVLCNQNPFFKVFKVPETKGISLNDFDDLIGSFQFSVGIRQFHGV